jgi:hydrogenase nickel incorporation protein HypA/HybF
MHELSVCRGLLREVERAAATHAARGISRIVIVVGPLSGVDAALLTRAFDAACAGTLAAGAALDVEIPPIRVRCEACGRESAASANRLACRDCGDGRVRLLSGDELLLKRVELSVAVDD